MNMGIKIATESTVKLGLLFFVKLWVSNAIENNVDINRGKLKFT
jgi:hypothetical protein